MGKALRASFQVFIDQIGSKVFLINYQDEQIITISEDTVGCGDQLVGC